ncbi:type II toxin-antitoxin system YoeB family toxin [Halomonas sp. G11]|nr:type II toxin-antitoxin system YoeB family toxin [Halomonas sp. G11]
MASIAGYGSRRIHEEHRLVYKVTEDALLIAQLGSSATLMASGARLC